MAKTGNYEPLFKSVNYDEAQTLKTMKQRFSACKIDNAKAKFYDGEEQALTDAIQLIDPNWIYSPKTILPWEDMAKTGNYKPVLEQADEDTALALKILKKRFTSCKNTNIPTQFYEGEEQALANAIQTLEPKWRFPTKTIKIIKDMLPWEEMANSGNYSPVLKYASEDSKALKIMKKRFLMCKQNNGQGKFYKGEEQALTNAIQLIDPNWRDSPKMLPWKAMAKSGNYDPLFKQANNDEAQVLKIMKQRFSACKAKKSNSRFYIKEEEVLTNAIQVLEPSWVYSPNILLPWKTMAERGDYSPLLEQFGEDTAKALTIMKQRLSACKSDVNRTKFYEGEEEALTKAVESLKAILKYNRTSPISLPPVIGVNIAEILADIRSAQGDFEAVIYGESPEENQRQRTLLRDEINRQFRDIWARVESGELVLNETERQALRQAELDFTFSKIYNPAAKNLIPGYGKALADFVKDLRKASQIADPMQRGQQMGAVIAVFNKKIDGIETSTDTATQRADENTRLPKREQQIRSDDAAPPEPRYPNRMSPEAAIAQIQSIMEKMAGNGEHL